MRFNKILLISPRFPKGRYPVSLYPLSGLGYIAEALLGAGFKVAVLDMNLRSNDDLEKKIADFKPDLIGLSMMTFGYKLTYDFIHQLKQSHPGIKIVAGGPHISTLKEAVLRECPDIDYGIILEGDRSVVQLCQGNSLDSIQGFIYQNGASIVVNPADAFIKDLDSLAFPRYTAFELQHYPTRQIGIVTSRGCPYDCIYCPVVSAIGKQFRKRSARNVVDEIEYWYGQGYRDIMVLDDNFTLLKERTEEICALLSQKDFKGLKLRCPNGIRADRVDYQLLKKMKEVGFEMIAFGVEAASDQVLKTIKKGEKLAIIEESVKNACDLGFDVDLFFLIGSPGETSADVEQSFAFALRYPIRSAMFYNIIPFPTTELHRWLSEKQLFLHSQEDILNNASHFINEPCFYTEQMSVKLRKQAFVKGQKISRRIRRKYVARKIKAPGVLRFILSFILTIPCVEQKLNSSTAMIKVKEIFKKVFRKN